MRHLQMCFAVVLLLLSCAAASAQSASAPTRVSVTCTCDDVSGQAYFAAIRKLLSADRHYREVSEEDANGAGAIQVSIVSIALEPKEGIPQAALSVVATRDGALLHQFITTCTRLSVVDTAMTVVHGIRQLED